MIGLTSGWMATVLSRVAVTVLACVVVGVLAYRTGRANGEAAVTAEWHLERAEIARATSKALERRIETETALRATIDRQREEHAREKDRIAAEHRRLVDSLRNRPERPSDGSLPNPAAAGPGTTACTGAQLYRDDGEFLARIAADADRLRAAVEHCAAAYDAVRAGILRLQDRSE